MSRGGHPPKHPIVRVLEGNRGKRPIPEMPVVPCSGNVMPPDWLQGDEVAVRFWNEHVPLLMSAGIMTDVDRETFAKACVWESISRERGLRFIERLQAHNAALRVWQDFGLTPISRVRLARRPLKDSPGTKWGAAL